MVKLTFLGHACFLVEDGAHRILVDPFLSGNPTASVSADEVEADYIFVTHGHGDHVGDAVSIAKRTGAKVCCTVDLAEAVFAPAGIEAVAGNIGGWVSFPFGRVKYVIAIHGSGTPGTLSNGFVFDLGGRKIYHAGDTALTMDMSLLEDEHLDAALLPIGDFFTMGPDDALRAVKMIKAGLTVPMHYNTFPPIRQDPDAFVQRVKDAGYGAQVLAIGESLSL